MLIYKKTSTLAVRHVLDPQVMGTVAEVVVKDGARILGHIAEEAAGKIAGDWVKKVAEKVRSHFTDHSEKLTDALAQSNEKAWKTIEIALGGQRFWDRFASAEDQALREQVKAFLESAVQEDDPGLPDRLPEGAAPGQGEGTPDDERRVPSGESRRGSRPIRPVRRSRGAAGRRVQRWSRRSPASSSAWVIAISVGCLAVTPTRGQPLAGDGRPVLLPPGRRRRPGPGPGADLGQADRDRPARAGRIRVPGPDPGAARPGARRGPGRAGPRGSRRRRDPRRRVEPARGRPAG